VFFTLLQNRVTGLHMEEDFHLCDTTLQKQGKSTKLFFYLYCYNVMFKNVLQACVFQNILFQWMARCRAVQMCFLEGAPKP
jgi:hypothetical protein